MMNTMNKTNTTNNYMPTAFSGIKWVSGVSGASGYSGSFGHSLPQGFSGATGNLQFHSFSFNGVGFSGCYGFKPAVLRSFQGQVFGKIKINE